MNRQIRPKLRPALAFVLLFQALALAQSEPSPWHEFRVIRVKADMVDEWRELQMNDVNPALKAAGVPYRAVWRYVFGNPNEWWSVTPIAAFSQYDELGRERVPQELSQKLSRCVVGEHVHVSLIHREGVKGPPIPPVAVVTRFRLVPGSEKEYRKLVKSFVLPAMHRIDAAAYEVHQSVFGGADGWFTVRLAETMAELDKGPSLKRGLDDKAYSLVVERLNAIQMDIERRVLRLDEELSFFPGASASGNN